MRVAVTGAGGYLGRPIVEALAGDERVDSVVAIDLRPPDAAPGVEPLKRDVRELEPHGFQCLRNRGARRGVHARPALPHPTLGACA